MKAVGEGAGVSNNSPDHRPVSTHKAWFLLDHTTGEREGRQREKEGFVAVCFVFGSKGRYRNNVEGGQELGESTAITSISLVLMSVL